MQLCIDNYQFLEYIYSIWNQNYNHRLFESRAIQVKNALLKHVGWQILIQSGPFRRKSEEIWFIWVIIPNGMHVHTHWDCVLDHLYCKWVLRQAEDMPTTREFDYNMSESTTFSSSTFTVRSQIIYFY